MGFELAARWSTDGQRIFFDGIKTAGTPGTDDIWVINVDGSNERQIIHTKVAPSRPDWQPTCMAK
jgi:Tol biopolymer transport system component